MQQVLVYLRWWYRLLCRLWSCSNCHWRRGEGPSVIETITNRFYGKVTLAWFVLRKKSSSSKRPFENFPRKSQRQNWWSQEIDAASKTNVDDAVAKARHTQNQNNSLLTSMSLTKERCQIKVFVMQLKKPLNQPWSNCICCWWRCSRWTRRTEDNQLEGFGGVLGVTKGQNLVRNVWLIRQLPSLQYGRGCCCNRFTSRCWLNVFYGVCHDMLYNQAAKFRLVEKQKRQWLYVAWLARVSSPAFSVTI